MTIAVNSAAKWKERYTEMINKSCYEYEQLNKEAEVKTRKLTPEEFDMIFGVNGNPNYIKEIGV